MSKPPTMGIGLLGNSNVVFSSKKRWTMSVDFPSGKVPEMFVKISSRPRLNEQNEIDQVGSITTTIIDCDPDTCKPLWDLLSAMYVQNTDTKTSEYQVAKDLMGTVVLTMYDAVGHACEKWILGEAYPTSIDFGDLDYSSSSETTVEITWNYNTCVFEPIVTNCPEIYGFKTPEKHAFTFVDGDPNRGINMQSTSGHKMELTDEGTKS